MINEQMYAFGAESSKIREIFSYACARKEEIGAENVFDFSLGNPSIPAPAAVQESIARSLAEVPAAELHGLHARARPAGGPCRRGLVA